MPDTGFSIKLSPPALQGVVEQIYERGFHIAVHNENLPMSATARITAIHVENNTGADCEQHFSGWEKATWTRITEGIGYVTIMNVRTSLAGNYTLKFQLEFNNQDLGITNAVDFIVGYYAAATSGTSVSSNSSDIDDTNDKSEYTVCSDDYSIAVKFGDSLPVFGSGWSADFHVYRSSISTPVRLIVRPLGQARIRAASKIRIDRIAVEEYKDGQWLPLDGSFILSWERFLENSGLMKKEDYYLSNEIRKPTDKIQYMAIVPKLQFLWMGSYRLRFKITIIGYGPLPETKPVIVDVTNIIQGVLLWARKLSAISCHGQHQIHRPVVNEKYTGLAINFQAERHFKLKEFDGNGFAAIDFKMCLTVIQEGRSQQYNVVDEKISSYVDWTRPTGLSNFSNHDRAATIVIPDITFRKAGEYQMSFSAVFGPNERITTTVPYELIVQSNPHNMHPT